MNRFLIVGLALLCGACHTSRGSDGPNPNASRIRLTPNQLTWFAVASQLRRCHGYNSTRGALLAATASSIGGIYYIRTSPAP